MWRVRLPRTRRLLTLQPALVPHHVTSGGYLDGVFLSDLSYSELRSATQWLDRLHIGPNSDAVYWSPGIETLSRELKTTPLKGIPIDFNSTTIRDATDRAIIDSLENSRRKIFLADPHWFGMYSSKILRSYLDHHWRLAQKQPLLVYTR